MRLDQIALLKEVALRHVPDLLPRITRELDASDEEVTRLENAILAEFLSSGLGPDDEPNDRGLALEALLDEVRRRRRLGAFESSR